MIFRSRNVAHGKNVAIRSAHCVLSECAHINSIDNAFSSSTVIKEKNLTSIKLTNIDKRVFVFFTVDL